MHNFREFLHSFCNLSQSLSEPKSNNYQSLAYKILLSLMADRLLACFRFTSIQFTISLSGFSINFQFIKQQFMLSYFFSSQSFFQTQLEEFLASDSSSLKDPLLHKLMAALRGEDSQTKSQIAFAALKKALTSFETDKTELRVLRELIILDKLVEEGIYCEEISKTTLFSLEGSQMGSSRAMGDGSARMLRLYWKIIKDKSLVINDREHIFHQKRSQRRHYLERLKLPAILNQINTLELFFNAIFELAYYLDATDRKEDEWKKGEVAHYVVLHLLYKLLGLYNCQTITQKYLIHKIHELTEIEALRLKKYIVKFKEHCHKFIAFIKAHRNNRGFELIHYEQIKIELNDKLTKFIDDYLKTLEIESTGLMLKTLPVSMGKIIVEKKPMGSMSRFNSNSRLYIKAESGAPRADKGEGNAFSNWHSSFSHEFPQKEIMTVDLILQLKLEQNSASREDESENGLSKELYLSRCSYDNRSTNVTSNYEVHYLARHDFSLKTLQPIHFESIYSKAHAKWNHI